MKSLKLLFTLPFDAPKARQIDTVKTAACIIFAGRIKDSTEKVCLKTHGNEATKEVQRAMDSP